MNKKLWYWNDKLVDKNEYNKLFVEAIENTRGIALCDIQCVGKDEIFKELGGTSNSATSESPNNGKTDISPWKEIYKTYLNDILDDKVM